jgi:hypothetical protein
MAQQLIFWGKKISPAQMKQIKGGDWWDPSGAGEGGESCQTAGLCEYAYECGIFPAGCTDLSQKLLLCQDGNCVLT